MTTARQGKVTYASKRSSRQKTGGREKRAEEAIPMDLDEEGVDIWYQVKDREEGLIKNFVGHYIDELLTKIADKEKLSNAASTLQLFVKQAFEKEIPLRELENKLGRNQTFDFRRLILEYDIWKKNPIIVRLPVVAHEGLGSAKISISSDNIKSEVDKIIEAISNNYHKKTVNLDKVIEFQKRKLGRFYREGYPLPYGKTARDLNPLMFGNLLEDKMPLSEETESVDSMTLHQIVMNDLERSDYCTVAMVGVSGAGKTATVVNLAMRHNVFVIYFSCTIENPDKPYEEFVDTNFEILAQDVTAMGERYATFESEDELRTNDSILRRLVKNRVHLEFLARAMFLLMLFKLNPELTSEEFYHEQINDRTAIKSLVVKLTEYDIQTIRGFTTFVETDLETFLKNRPIIIAVDEAQLAVTGILKDKFVSSAALQENEPLLDATNKLLKKHVRSFLSPLCEALCSKFGTLVILGTKLTLKHADVIYSAAGKPSSFKKMTIFPLYNEEDVKAVAKKTLNLSDCRIPDNIQKLVGRPRFSSRICTYIKDDNTKSKEEVLAAAIDKTIKDFKEYIIVRVQKLWDRDNIGEIKNLFSRIILAHKLGSEIAFPQTDDIDFLEHALCSIKKSDNYRWVISEPLVIDAIEEVLKVENFFEFRESMRKLTSILGMLGIFSSSKGEVFEIIVRLALQRFNNYIVAKLPFVEGIPGLPEWCKTTRLQVNKIGTAAELGYGEGVKGDLEFFKAQPENVMLVPSKGTRMDGLMFFDRRHGLSLAIKLLISNLDKKEFTQYMMSSDIRMSFLTENKSLVKFREEFKMLPVKELDGILRIHVMFPGVVADCDQTSRVNKEDVIVYINLNNMDTFDETINKDEETIRDLKDLILYVAKGGQLMTCHCQAGCFTDRCYCFKAQGKCGPHCHSGRSWGNL